MKVRDKDLLIDEDEDRIDEIRQAQEQQKAMMDGEDVEESQENHKPTDTPMLLNY